LAADRGLVDLYDLVDLLDAVDAIVGAGWVFGGVELAGQGLGQGVVDEGALARARHASDDGEGAEGEGGIDLLEVVAAGAAQQEGRAVGGAAAGGQGDRLLAAEVAGGQRRRGEEFRGAALGDQSTALAAGAGADLDEVIGPGHRVGVVLDHEDGVALIAQAHQGVQQAVLVAGVQADAGLVEHIGDALQAAADLAGEADALALAAGEGGGGAVEAEVAQTDVAQKAEAGAQLFDDRRADDRLAPRQGDGGEEGLRLVDGHGRQLGDALAAKVHRQGDRVQSLS